jgi:hypothetical protein
MAGKVADQADSRGYQQLFTAILLQEGMGQQTTQQVCTVVLQLVAKTSCAAVTIQTLCKHAAKNI